MTPQTEGTLLGGRVRHAQPAAGHRTGLEPVLLAASVPATPGERVLEGGTGSGAGLICLAARVAGISGVGVERDVNMAAIARANIAANDMTGLLVVDGDLLEHAPEGSFDHAFANPPWHDARGTASPDEAREAARRGAADLLGRWTAALARPLRPRGTLTLVIAATALPAAMAALAAHRCGSLAVLPLWPKAGRAAKLVLLRGIKQGRAPFRLLPGLLLHAPDGGFTEAANAVLRHAAPLSFDAAIPSSVIKL